MTTVNTANNIMQSPVKAKPAAVQLPQHTAPMPLPQLAYSPTEPSFIQHTQRRLSTLSPNTYHAPTSPNSSINFATTLSIQTPIGMSYAQHQQNATSPNTMSVDNSINFFNLQSSPIYNSQSLNFIVATPIDTMLNSSIIQQSTQYPAFPSRHSPQQQPTQQYYATQYYEPPPPQQQQQNSTAAPVPPIPAITQQQYTAPQYNDNNQRAQHNAPMPSRQRSQHTLLGYDGGNKQSHVPNHPTSHMQPHHISPHTYAQPHTHILPQQQQQTSHTQYTAAQLSQFQYQTGIPQQQLFNDRQQSWSHHTPYNDMSTVPDMFTSRANSAQPMPVQSNNKNMKLPPTHNNTQQLKVQVPTNRGTSTDTDHSNTVLTEPVSATTSRGSSNPASNALSPPMDIRVAAMSIHSPQLTDDPEQSPNDSSDSLTKNSHDGTDTPGHSKDTAGPPFECEFCQRQFTRNSNLTRHKRIHGSEKRFQCSECDKHFMEKHHLAAHERTHTGEKPYQCKICNRTFTDRSNCTRHERTHSTSVLTADNIHSNTLLPPQQTFNPRSQSHGLYEQHSADIDPDDMFNTVADTLLPTYTLVKSRSTSNIPSQNTKSVRKRKQKNATTESTDTLEECMSPTKKNNNTIDHTAVLAAAGFSQAAHTKNEIGTLPPIHIIATDRTQLRRDSLQSSLFDLPPQHDTQKSHTPPRHTDENQFMLPRGSISNHRRNSNELLQSPPFTVSTPHRNSLLFGSPPVNWPTPATLQQLPQYTPAYNSMQNMMSPIVSNNENSNTMNQSPNAFLHRIETDQANQETITLRHMNTTMKSITSNDPNMFDEHINA